MYGSKSRWRAKASATRRHDRLSHPSPHGLHRGDGQHDKPERWTRRRSRGCGGGAPKGRRAAPSLAVSHRGTLAAQPASHQLRRRGAWDEAHTLRSMVQNHRHNTHEVGRRRSTTWPNACNTVVGSV